MNKLIYILLFISISISAQKMEHRVEVYQDFKLLTYENEHGLTPPTMDVLIKYTLSNKVGVSFNYEYANLKTTYQRLTIGLWHFDKSITDKFNASLDVEIGFLKHKDWYVTHGGQIGASYKVMDKMSLAVLYQLATRPEIDKITNSVFIGLQYKIK